MANQNRIVRKKINLIRRRGGKKTMDGFIWLVGKQQNSKMFYVADYDDDNNTIMWSAIKEDCIYFKTELAVHDFVHKHLNSRTDIILVQSRKP